MGINTRTPPSRRNNLPLFTWFYYRLAAFWYPTRCINSESPQHQANCFLGGEKYKLPAEINKNNTQKNTTRSAGRYLLHINIQRTPRPEREAHRHTHQPHHRLHLIRLFHLADWNVAVTFAERNICACLKYGPIFQIQSDNRTTMNHTRRCLPKNNSLILHKYFCAWNVNLLFVFVS